MNLPNLGPQAERERQRQIVQATRTAPKRPAKAQDDASTLALFAVAEAPTLL